MVESADAEKILMLLEQVYPGYRVNFDLDDCDHILRIKYEGGLPDIIGVTNIVFEAGFIAMVLTENMEGSQMLISMGCLNIMVLLTLLM